MIVMFFIAAGILVGFLRGGSLARLAGLDLRHGWLVFLGLALQLVAFKGGLPADFWAPAVHVLSYMVLVAGIAFNFRHWPMQVLGLGLLFNLAAIAANGGYMPAAAEALRLAGMEAQLDHLLAYGTLTNSTLLSETTRLIYLTDHFYLPAAVPGASVFSAGDVLIGLGVMLLVARGMTLKATAMGDYGRALELIRNWPAPVVGPHPSVRAH